MSKPQKRQRHLALIIWVSERGTLSVSLAMPQIFACFRKTPYSSRRRMMAELSSFGTNTPPAEFVNEWAVEVASVCTP